MWDLLGLAWLTQRKGETLEQSFWGLVTTGFVLLLLATVFICASGGCMKRAPTNYELDRRAGMATPPPEAQFESERQKKKHRKQNPTFTEPLWTSSTLAAAPVMPARVQPVVRKIWVPDQLLEDGSWLQGTWMFVEVEPAHWLPEVDPGGAPFATQTKGPKSVKEALDQALTTEVD